MSRISLVAAAASVAAACAHSEHFAPTETTSTGLSPQGHHAQAVYNLSVDGRKVGKATVWVPHAKKIEGRYQVEAVVNIANTGDEPITLNSTDAWLEAVRTDSGTIGRVPVSAVSGQTVVPPSSIREVRLLFTLPPLEHGDIDDFQLHWSVSAAGETLAEYTPFAEVHYEDYYGYGYPYDYYWGPYPYYSASYGYSGPWRY